MKDSECVEFLQWALPRLHMKWSGFRKVRKQVCKRIDRRMSELGVSSPRDYRAHLEKHGEEWNALDTLCRITISRFYRDRRVFSFLDEVVLPDLARSASERGDAELRCWSAGCASGEEPYSLAILWRLHHGQRFPALRMRMLATDIDENLLSRARKAIYPPSSLRDCPKELTASAFDRRENEFALRPAYREGVELIQEDIRHQLPDGPFHLILCRYLVFTYFEQQLQRQIASRLVSRLVEGGALVIGPKETLPNDAASLVPWDACPGVYRKA